MCRDRYRKKQKVEKKGKKDEICIEIKIVMFDTNLYHLNYLRVNYTI